MKDLPSIYSSDSYGLYPYHFEEDFGMSSRQVLVQDRFDFEPFHNGK